MLKRKEKDKHTTRGGHIGMLTEGESRGNRGGIEGNNGRDEKKKFGIFGLKKMKRIYFDRSNIDH
jgi:hypothetical protein